MAAAAAEQYLHAQSGPRSAVGPAKMLTSRKKTPASAANGASATAGKTAGPHGAEADVLPVGDAVFLERRAHQLYALILLTWIFVPMPIWLGPWWMVADSWAVRMFFVATTIFGLVCTALFRRGYFTPETGAYLNIVYCFSMATVFCLFSGGLNSPDVTILFFQLQVCDSLSP